MDSLRVRLLGALLALNTGVALGGTILRTGFEASDDKPYIIGNLHGQNGWSLSAGEASITNDPALVKSGFQSAYLRANNQSLILNQTVFSGTEAGVGGILYADFWVKIISLTNKSFTLNGYDLFGGSQKRTFVFEFGTPSTSGGEFRIFSGPNRVTVGQYILNNWYRVCLKVDFERSQYQVIFNGGSPVSANFREDYTPTASGSRQAGIKEFHQLRINLGYDTAVGSVLAAIDEIYIGTDPIEGVFFDPIVSKYTLTIEQPAVGTISVDPLLTEYPESTLVTATLTLPEGYLNLGWTGDLSGTTLNHTFYIVKNMTIGAQVGIDPFNPPPQYTVTLLQPTYGAINLQPAGGVYYKHTLVTASLTVPTGYLFTGWTGDLSGTELTKSFRVLNDLTIGAVVVPDTTPPKIYRITTAAELKTVLKGTSLRAGDIVEVEDGIYDTGANITIESSGTESKPIMIRAKNIGGAVLSGKTAFTLREAAYIQVEGFDWRSNVYTAIKLEACHHIRITRNLFHLTETEGQSGKWIYVGGLYNDPYAPSHHNFIDHNLFENKHQLGNFITIDGQQEPVFQVSQYDRIEFNHFRNIGPRAVNEMEAIRVGVSDLSLSSGYTIIENNLFENCDGDPEIISIKSCDDTVRYNTFQHCQGTLCLRHGNRSVAAGNFFFGDHKAGTGGIRLYGNDHKIYNNYFEGLTGSQWDAALTLTNGDYDGENSGGLTEHWRIKRAFIGFNTLVNCFSNLEIGFTNNGSYKKPPQDLVIANNLVVAKLNPIVKIITTPLNTTWQGNIMFPDSAATLGISLSDCEIRMLDPQLAYRFGLWQLTATSPAIDAAIGSYPWLKTDFLGQPRDETPDVGADEFSAAPIVRLPLTAANVGPWAIEPQLSVQNEKHLTSPNHNQLQSYPNPTNAAALIEFTIPARAPVRVGIYNLSGQLVTQLLDRELDAGKYALSWQPGDAPSGVYLIRLQHGATQKTLRLTIIK